MRAARAEDAAAWERMRQALWPSPPGEHAAEIEAFFRGDRRNPAQVLVAWRGTDTPVGFAELSVRPYAEDCHSGRVAYLEGWYVEPGERRRGAGAALVRAAEEWGRSLGCTEFASDTHLENAASAAAHRACGFTETRRIICFRKTL